MQYKTIIMTMIEDQPSLHEMLRASRMVVSTIDTLAVELKTVHEEWKDKLSQSDPNLNPTSRSSQAMELALHHMQQQLDSMMPDRDSEDVFSLPQVMDHIKRHTPQG